MADAQRETAWMSDSAEFFQSIIVIVVAFSVRFARNAISHRSQSISPTLRALFALRSPPETISNRIKQKTYFSPF